MQHWRARLAMVASGLLVWGQLSAAATSTAPAYIRANHAAVVEQWLLANPGYRIATDADCSCTDDISRLREFSTGVWRANANFHPYYTVGDFNWDGIPDFAVGVVRGGHPDQFMIVIFQGPFGSGHSAKAAFVSAPFKLGQSMFFGDPRPLPHMLVVGPFESEGAVLRPSVYGYAWVPEQ